MLTSGRLLVAAGANHSEVVKYLLDHGADPAIRGTESDFSRKSYGFYAGSNALESAAQHGDVEILKMMLDKPGIEVTPMAIQTAAMGGYEALKLLLDHGGYVVQNQSEDKSRQPSKAKLQAVIDAAPTAVEHGDLATLKLLLGYRFPALKHGDFTHFNVPDDLRIPFTYGAYNAVILNQVDKFEFIYSLGLREHDTMSLDDIPEGQTINIQHLLDKAAGAGSIDCARLLIEKYGADPNKYRMPGGVLPLYHAAINNKPEMVRFLLEKYNVDIHMGNGRYAAGPTALWMAICLKHFEVVTLLLEHGGPVDHIDDEIVNTEDSLRAVLLTEVDNCRVRFKTEANAKEYIESAKHNYAVPNPPYVRLSVGPQDKDCIAKLELRRSDEDLRETGEGARELNEKEAAKLEDLEPTDVRHILAPLPTIEERQEQLDEDDDLIPEFIPMFKA
jgi:ankyrin repeat protein